MEEGILEFKNEFEKAGGDPEKVSLEALKSKMGEKYDLIIIDSGTTIIKSTAPEGINFNFMQFDEKLGEEINSIRLSEDIRHERIRTNVGTGHLSKFTYIPTDDHKYLLEIAYGEGGLSSFVSELELLKIAAQLVHANPIVSSIRIFDVYGYEFVGSKGNYQPTEESIRIVERVKKEIKYEVDDGDKVKSYFLIDSKEKKQTMTDNGKIVEIVYNNTAMANSIKSITYLISAVGFGVIVIMILIMFYLSKKITYPITLLSIAAKKVAKGDYDVIAEKTSQDEIGELSDIFNTMIKKIKEDFEKIEKQKAELEDYSRNLERKVQDRTIEIVRTLEKSKITQKLLEESNLQFENLFNNMREGFAIHEIVCNEKGVPVDYRFLEVNKAFQDITGLKIADIKNKTVLEIMPGIESYWIKEYGRVALTGEPFQFENYSEVIGKHFSVNVFSPAEGKFATVFTDITRQVLSRETIKREKYILERILDDTLSGYWDWDLVNNTEYLSPGLKKMLGYEDHELLNSPETWQRLIFSEDLPMVMKCFNKHVESLGSVPFYNEVRYHHKDGSTVWVIFAGHVVEWDADNRPLQMVGCHINITDIKKLEKSLNQERELLKATLLSMGDGVISTDKDGKVKIVNAVAEELTGWTHEDAYGKPFEEVFNIVNEDTREKCGNPIGKVHETGETIKICNHTILISKDGVERPIEDNAAPIKDENGDTSGVVMIFRDFTEKKEKQERIEYLSFHDQLTGLFNRRFLEEKLKEMDSKRNLPLTLVMLDVNGLKLINDAFGHSVGDKVLQKAAEIVKRECRSDDIIARFGGDEFVILLPHTNSIDVEMILRRIDTLIENERVDSINLSVSYGWATKNKASENTADIFKIAEDHMYRRKLTESKSMHYKTIEIILKTLHEKSEREKKHSERVSQLCESIGVALGLKNEDVRELRTTGLMHDIGKIAIDLSILDKQSQLNDSEWTQIQRHPELGYQILRSLNEFAKIAEYVLAHHERWDGKGYPRGLKGDEIPLEARIIAVADAYDAMTSDRPYRRALSKEVAMNEIKNNAGIQFDPQIVKIFIDVSKN